MNTDKPEVRSLPKTDSKGDLPRVMTGPVSSRTSTTISNREQDPEKAIHETVATEEINKDDANLVDWDGPDDPEKPLNWTKKKKWMNMMLIATLTMLTPFGSSMFAPGVPDMMKEFHSDNVDLASFVVSIYVLGYVQLRCQVWI